MTKHITVAPKSSLCPENNCNGTFSMQYMVINRNAPEKEDIETRFPSRSLCQCSFATRLYWPWPWHYFHEGSLGKVWTSIRVPFARLWLERLWMDATDVIVSLPMGYDKGVISSLWGRFLSAKDGQAEDGITIIVVPINMIQYYQVASLAKHGITACKMAIEGKHIPCHECGWSLW